MLEQAKNIVLRLIKDDRAGIMTMTALMFPMLLGFAGMGIDITSWYMERRTTQSLVDTAAVEGAHHKVNYTTSEMQDLVIQFATAQGYDATQDTLTINNPPLRGNHIGDEGFVEVINDRQSTLYFVSAFYALFNGQSFTVTVQSRGVAGAVVLGQACVVALSPDSNRSLNFSGTTTVTSDCGIACNSTSESCLQVGGNATVDVPHASAVGNYRNIGGGTLTDSDGADIIPQTSGSEVNDPYDGIPMPPADTEDELVAPDADCAEGYDNGDQPVDAATVGELHYLEADMVLAYDIFTTATPPMVIGDPYYILAPGTYCSGLKVQENVFFTPGEYIIHNGDFDSNAGSVIWGDDISFFLTGDTSADVGGMTQNGQVTIEFSASIDGEYAGILFFQDLQGGTCAANQQVLFNGGADMFLDGVIYVPSCPITISGGASAAPSCLKLYGYTVEFSGDSHVGNDETVCESIGITETGSDLTRVQLVE